MRRKKTVRIVIIALVLALGIGGAYLAVIYSQTCSPDDLQAAAEQFIHDYEKDEKVIEFGQEKASTFDEVYAIAVKTELDKEQKVKCVVFERNTVFKKRYSPQSIFATNPGEIKAYRQRAGTAYFDYIFGMDISKDKSSFTIPATKYSGKASEGEFLSIEDVSYVGPMEVEYR